MHAASSLLLIVDVQEKLAAAMDPQALDRMLANCETLLAAAKLLGTPVIATEQYPKGLGLTVPRIAAASAYEKMEFDATANEAIHRAIDAANAQSIVIAGMETHICVYQTARSLAKRFETFVVADAVLSRTDANRLAGLSLCRAAGAIETVTEAVVFDWLGRAGTPEFKEISRRVR